MPYVPHLHSDPKSTDEKLTSATFSHSPYDVYIKKSHGHYIALAHECYHVFVCLKSSRPITTLMSNQQYFS